MKREARWMRARRVAGFERLFSRYLRWLVERSFSKVWLHGSAAPLPKHGFVAAANHSSWWDGFIPYLLHRAQTAAPFAIMMSDAELRRFPFFRWGGAFSVDSASTRTAREAIVYAGKEANAGAGVWIFPQGVLDVKCEQGAFTGGFVHAARRGDVPIVPVAMRFAMLGKQRPEAFVDIAPPIEDLGRGARVRAADAILERLQRIDESIRDGSCGQTFLPLFSGAAGVDSGIAAVTGVWRKCP